MKQGERGNCAYLIQSGRALVFAESGDKTVELAKLEQGQIVGEMALVFDAPRTASVKAIEDMNLIVLTRQTMEQKLKQSDATIRALVEMLIKRVVSTNNTIVSNQQDSKDLTDTVNVIYENVHAALPEDKQKDFADQVLPKLNDFIASVKSFQD